MKSSTKLLLTTFLVVYGLTLAIFAINLFLGSKIALWIVCSILCLALICLSVLLLGPLVKVKKIYSQKPPRMMYETISSRADYCRLCNISKWFLLAVKCGEDHMFFNHKGINFDSLLNAVAGDIFEKKEIGGSTITQQLIKNIYLTADKSISRKICEFLMVGRLEKELSKNEIFELYVNVIYYGFEKYGISSASKFYYHCSPAELSFDQSISLAAILPCPDKYNAKANPVFFYQVRQNMIRKILTFSDIKFNQLVELYSQNENKRI